jgi:N-acetylglutamate synthase-like GNAT family acetyltransferase
MTPHPTARWATTTDLEFLQTTGHVHLSESILRRKIEWREAIVTTVNDSLVGCLYLDHLWSSVPFIALIWVLEAHRHKGVGRTLLHFVENHARAQGQSLLYSSSQLDEPEPQAWHRSMGFEECGILAKHNNGVGEVLFCKHLG